MSTRYEWLNEFAPRIVPADTALGECDTDSPAMLLGLDTVMVVEGDLDAIAGQLRDALSVVERAQATAKPCRWCRAVVLNAGDEPQCRDCAEYEANQPQLPCDDCGAAPGQDCGPPCTNEGC